MDPILITLGMLGAGAVCGAVWAVARARPPRAEPPAPIQDGPTTMFGHVDGHGEYIVAPVSKTKCLAFEVKFFLGDADEPFARLSECLAFSLMTDEAPVLVEAQPTK